MFVNETSKPVLRVRIVVRFPVPNLVVTWNVFLRTPAYTLTALVTGSKLRKQNLNRYPIHGELVMTVRRRCELLQHKDSGKKTWIEWESNPRFP